MTYSLEAIRIQKMRFETCRIYPKCTQSDLSRHVVKRVNLDIFRRLNLIK